MKHTPVQKPSLGEIFAALKGVRCAGFALMDDPHGTMHPLVDAGVEAIKVSYDLRAEMMTRTDIGVGKHKPTQQFTLVTKDAEKSARLALEFLERQMPVLMQYADITLQQGSKAGNISGGSVANLIAHIDQMVQFEKIGIARQESTIARDGVLSPVYKAQYLPEYFVAVPVEEKKASIGAAKVSVQMPELAAV